MSIIEMRYYLPREMVSDISLLKRLARNFDYLAEDCERVRVAYGAYLKTEGSPQLPAADVSDELVTLLHRLYEGASKNHGFDWIHRIRDAQLTSCPMCGNLSVGTVEHYLPKNPFPEFSVFSFNLVPSCNACNRKRGSRHKNGIKYKLLHPAFDKDLFGRIELVTRFDMSGTVLDFELDFRGDKLSADEQLRVSAHIKLCIDRREFRQVTNSQIGSLAARLDIDEPDGWVAEIEKELSVMTRAQLNYGWGAACLRGILDMSAKDRNYLLLNRIQELGLIENQ
ncbi:hypothetical protein [Pseudomonas asiatica]|uniref:hypothetical protein n=1 Tax=Pseudomonas TaxID=286 RepID=UPI00383A2DA2